MSAPRDLLLAMYRAAVDVAHPRTCLPAHLPPVPERGRLIVVGAGKANAAMAVAAEVHYRAAGVLDRVAGFVTTRHGFVLPTHHLAVVEAAHPVPDEAGRTAAQRTLDLIVQAGPEDTVLVLMSGGASALWPAPVDGVSFADMQAFTRQLLKSGLPIGAMNTLRRHLSRIQGGRLAALAHPRRVVTLAISDVPRDEPEAIGSGPTVPDVTTLADARAVLAALSTRLARDGLAPPPSIAAALADPHNESVKPGDGRLANTSFKIVAAPKASIEAAAMLARAAGFRIEVLGDALEGEARDVARTHGQLARDAQRRGDRVAILSGGELTVTIPTASRGSGGPNQEYALSLAIALGGMSAIHALAADTDGIDGGGGANTDPAGALVTPDTLARAGAIGLDPAARLADNDSTGFFRPLGDLVEVGPTQTNVNDLRIILVDPA